MSASRVWICLFVLFETSAFAAPKENCFKSAIRRALGTDISVMAINEKRLLERVGQVGKEAGGNPVREIELTSKIYLDEILQSFPEDLREAVRERLRTAKMHSIHSQEPNVSLAEALQNPNQAIAEGLKLRQEAQDIIDTTPIFIRREFYSVLAADTLMKISEISRVSNLLTEPIWRRVALIAILNPYPASSFARATVQKVAASRQWEYIHLIPKENHNLILENLEKERASFLRLNRTKEQKDEVNKIFIEMRDSIKNASRMSKSDFIKYSENQFSLSKDILVEYAFKVPFYAVLGTLGYMELSNQKPL